MSQLIPVSVGHNEQDNTRNNQIYHNIMYKQLQERRTKKHQEAIHICIFYIGSRALPPTRPPRAGRSGAIYTIIYYTIIQYALYNIQYTIYYTILYYTIIYYTILYYTILYYTILYYTILYYTILYYTILYYTILTIPKAHVHRVGHLLRPDQAGALQNKNKIIQTNSNNNVQRKTHHNNEHSNKHVNKTHKLNTYNKPTTKTTNQKQARALSAHHALPVQAPGTNCSMT